VRDGDNDTSVTGCMVAVLRAARLAELETDRGSIRGAIAWIDKMTEPEFGRVGYQTRGGRGQRYKGDHKRFPVEAGEPLTAIGIAIRAIGGGDPKEDEYMQKGATLLVKSLPSWDMDSGEIDFYYWYWGSLAMNEMGGRFHEVWDEALVEQTTLNQRIETGRDERGSWDPVGPWARASGRIGSTALACLALQAPWRYPNKRRRR
jgi:hypothetical protein